MTSATGPESSSLAHQVVQTTEEWGIGDLFEFVRPEWHAQAACRGQVDLMYPTTHGKSQGYYLCEVCPVRKPCLDAGVEGNEPDGIWGGASYRKRRQLRKERGLTRQPRQLGHGQIAMWRSGCECGRCKEAHQREVRRGRLKDLGGAA